MFSDSYFEPVTPTKLDLFSTKSVLERVIWIANNSSSLYITGMSSMSPHFNSPKSEMDYTHLQWRKLQQLINNKNRSANPPVCTSKQRFSETFNCFISTQPKDYTVQLPRRPVSKPTTLWKSQISLTNIYLQSAKADSLYCPSLCPPLLPHLHLSSHPWSMTQSLLHSPCTLLPHPDSEYVKIKNKYS